MSSQTAAVAFRHIIVSDLATTPGDCLVGLNTALLPQGALGYVSTTNTSYRLDKTLSAGTAPLYITPDVGPGRWVEQGSNANAALSTDVIGTANFTAAGAIQPVQNVWQALANGSAFYAASALSSYWALDASTGILTYSGPTKVFLVNAVFSVLGSQIHDTLEVDMTLNGALIGQSTAQQTSTRQELPDASSETSLATLRMLSIANGSTLQHVFRDVTATPGTVTFTRYQVQILAQG